MSHVNVQCKFLLKIIRHFTRFAVLCQLPNKETDTIAQTLIDWVLNIFRGLESESNVIYQLQQILGQILGTTRLAPHCTDIREIPSPNAYKLPFRRY